MNAHDTLIFFVGYWVAELVMPIVRRWPPFDRANSALARVFDRAVDGLSWAINRALRAVKH